MIVQGMDGVKRWSTQRVGYKWAALKFVGVDCYAFVD